MEKTVLFPRKRETGEIYQDALRFLHSERKPLARIIAVYVLPFLLIYAAAQVFMQMKLAGSADLMREMEPEKLIKEIGPVYKNLMITLAFYLFVQSLYMAAIFSYVQVYVARGKGGFTSGEVITLLSSNALLALGASLGVAFISFSGLFLLIIPGLILANSLSLTPFIAIFERKGIPFALLRSFLLTSKGWWHTLVLNLTGILIIWGVNILLTLPLSAMLTATGSATPASAAAAPPAAVTAAALPTELWQWIALGAALAISSLFAILPFLFQAFQYFNLTARIQKPGEDGH